MHLIFIIFLYTRSWKYCFQVFSIFSQSVCHRHLEEECSSFTISMNSINGHLVLFPLRKNFLSLDASLIISFLGIRDTFMKEKERRMKTIKRFAKKQDISMLNVTFLLCHSYVLKFTILSLNFD